MNRTAPLSKDSSVSLVGVGNLGGPMALAMLDAGWNVEVIDRDEGRVGPIVEAGATEGTAESLAASDVLIIVVSDDHAVSAILEGEAGAIVNGAAGRTVLVHSTVLPTTAQRLAQLAAEHDITFLDAPVSGGSERARRGELTVMVGAERSALVRAQPVLDVLSNRVVHVGPPGAGAATKLANQMMMFSSLAGVYEGLDIAQAFGVSADDVLDVVSTSTGASWVAENWGFFPKTARAYAESGTRLRDRPWVKDLHEAIVAAHEVEVDLPVTALLAQTLARRIEASQDK